MSVISAIRFKKVTEYPCGTQNNGNFPVELNLHPVVIKNSQSANDITTATRHRQLCIVVNLGMILLRPYCSFLVIKIMLQILLLMERSERLLGSFCR